AAAVLRIESEVVAEERGQTLHDREAQPHALRAGARRVAELEELVEDPLPVFRAYADSRVAPRDTPARLARRHGREPHGALRGVADRVRKQVADDALEEH